MNGLEWVVPLLVCPSCRRGLTLRLDGTHSDGVLLHDQEGCDEQFPVIGAIPRLITGAPRGEVVRRHAAWFAATPARRTIGTRWSMVPNDANAVVRGFDYEWARFKHVGTDDIRAVFSLYFDLLGPESFRTDRVVLDAGCGAGRWACAVAAHGPRVVAIDLGASAELARANAGDSDRIACVQADLRELPIREASLDWAYSLGVLHHVEGAERALARIVSTVHPGSEVLLYLYYAFDQRGPLFRALFRVVDAIRRAVSRAPRLLVLLISSIFATCVYWPLARLSKVFARLGLRKLANALPLAFYRDRSFATMRNDSLDRFGTRLERRYSRATMAALLRAAGTEDVRFSDQPPYWHAVARRCATMTP